jgi:transcriptional regulator with XRE-family HTH domain
MEERNRLNLKAKDVAEFVGVAIPTQSNYEQGKRFPDALYLMKLTKLGFNINYVLTGERDSELLNTQEKRLIELFRDAPEAVQKHILNGLKNQEL